MTGPAFGFSDTERALLEGAVEASMVDTCIILSYQEERDELGDTVVTYVASDPTPCRYYALRSNYRPQPEYILVDVDARCVLPLGTVVSSRDLMDITHRLGALLPTPLHYDVHGDPTPGVMSVEVALAEHHL